MPTFTPKPRISSASAGSRQGEAGNAATAARIDRSAFGLPCASMTNASSRNASPSTARATVIAPALRDRAVPSSTISP